ncbi:MAG TPA: ABC transporter transmembrane domain-containing protein, partial [Acidimicrobiales bacterium]
MAGITEADAGRPGRGDPRRRAAVRAAVRAYLGQMWEDRWLTAPGLLLPGLGSVFVWFVPALVVARVLARFDDGERPAAGELTPYLLAFAGAWLFGELLWRLGIHLLIRADARGVATLQRRGMDALFEQDLAFFHDDFAGSLTKKVVNYGASYEAFMDTLAFNVSSNVVPMGFAGVVLWHYSPWLVVALVGMVAVTGAAVLPLIFRRQALVDAREAASNHVAAHVADTLTNMDAVRLFAREDEESATHARNVERWRTWAVRSWDYQNLRVETLT